MILSSEIATATTAPQRTATPVNTNVFSRWGEQMSSQLLTLEGRNLQPAEPFSGRAAIARFHRCVVADIRASSHRVMRTRSLISADEDRHFTACWPAASNWSRKAQS